MPRGGAPGTEVEVTTTATSYTVDHSKDISLVVKVGRWLKVCFLHTKRNTAVNQYTIELIICSLSGKVFSINNAHCSL